MLLSRGEQKGGNGLSSLSARILAGTLAAFLAMVAPDLEWLLPRAISHRRLTLVLLLLAASYGLARILVARRRTPAAGRDHPARLLWGVDACAAIVLSHGLTIAVAATSLAFLATWIPHYVLWPWHRDADTFATLARSWDAGILPYRDIRAYNFPGAIYLHWLLARVFGWGRTWPLYAFDAACLVGLGPILAAWSRRTSGRCLPGLASYLVFLTYYLSCDYQIVAGRDWHTVLCVGLALTALQAWPGRTSRIVAAALTAIAISIRPHAVLFLPAMAWAVWVGTDRAHDGSPDVGTPPLRRLAIWFLTLGAFTAAAFSPLIISGTADDLMRGMRVAVYGGPYSRANLTTAARVLGDQLRQPQTAIEILLSIFLLAVTRGYARRQAATWALALGAALSYRLVHPVQHRYLALPLDLIGSISVTPSIAWIVGRAAVPCLFRAIFAIVLVVEVSLGPPTFCRPRAAYEAVADLAHGRTIPVASPPGAGNWFEIRDARWYSWEDYRDTLVYLRGRAYPDMLVANVLREPPFPAINGPTGCLSPFRAESGICWMWLVPIDLEPEFAADLEQAADCLVVWSPEQHRYPSQLRLDRLVSVIREHYRPEARFGRIEVWSRIPRGPQEGPRVRP